MKKIQKKTVFLCVVLLVVTLLLPSVVMKVKASGTATATVSIYFMESLDSDSDPFIMEKEVTITDYVQNEDGTYNGTISLDSIKYEKTPGDIRYIFNLYTMQDDMYKPINYQFTLNEVLADGADGIYFIELYAVYGQTIKIEYDNNGYYMNESQVTETKYYPQENISETERTIIFPEPSTLADNFAPNGYVFKGWGETDSGDVEINEITLSNGNSKIMYAHWQDLRPLNGVIAEVGEYYLETDKAYTLGDGTWTVNGDTTKYTGGITFYVTTTGNYTFSRE